jgi:hypothetical protein
MAQKRIHLAAPGGGAACGAHSLGKPNGVREVMASAHRALVDCRKCQYTDQYKAEDNPQLKLRLFQVIDGKRVLNPALAEPQRKMTA